MMTKDKNWYARLSEIAYQVIFIFNNNNNVYRAMLISSLQVNFLKEFCAFSQTLQPQNRDAFFKTLSNMGILPALEVILVSLAICNTSESGWLLACKTTCCWCECLRFK